MSVLSRSDLIGRFLCLLLGQWGKGESFQVCEEKQVMDVEEEKLATLEKIIA